MKNKKVVEQFCCEKIPPFILKFEFVNKAIFGLKKMFVRLKFYTNNHNTLIGFCITITIITETRAKSVNGVKTHNFWLLPGIFPAI